MTAPIEVLAKRYRCPFCPRSLSSKARMVEHIGKCWKNPAARGCKTCRHFSPADTLDGDSCWLGVDLTAPCRDCEGTEGMACQTCGDSRRDQDGATRPIAGCGLWDEA